MHLGTLHIMLADVLMRLLFPLLSWPSPAVTLQYGLTQAPASQPRNILYGQIVSLSLALVINLSVSAETWVRVPLTTSLAIAAMCKLGITHPPAGGELGFFLSFFHVSPLLANPPFLVTAAATIFALSDQSATSQFAYFGLMLLGNIIAILTAVLINNLNDKSHYPMYYAFLQDSCQDGLESALKSMVIYPKRRKQNTSDT